MRPKVYIRADGDSRIGLGHLVRCIALARMLNKGFDIAFCYKLAPEDTINEIINAGFASRKIESEEDWLNMLNTGDIAVLDGYDFDIHLHKRVRNTGAKLVCIDDVHDKPIDADLIINHAPGVKPSDYNAQPYTKFALGPEYALLRPEFLKAARRDREISAIENIFVCFGGSDSKNYTQRVLQQVVLYSKFKKIHVITGTSYQYVSDIKQLAKKDERILIYQALNASEMLKIMLDSELAIVPASGILIEALACKCLIISGMSADNQKEIFENYRKLKAFISVSCFESENVKLALKKAFEKQYDKPNPIIDGFSGNRLKRKINQLLPDKTIILRIANKDDLDLTFNWASNSVTWKYSYTKHQITQTEHRNWFLSKISNPDCIYYIAEINNKAIGSIRFDIEGNSAVISYLIDPSLHGKGLGQDVLCLGIEKFIEEIYKSKIVANIIGYVMKDNIPSIKAFQRMGFNQEKQNDQIKFIKRV